MNLLSDFYIDLSYIKFIIIVFNSGKYQDTTIEEQEINNQIENDIQFIKNEYNKIIRLLSKTQIKKVDDISNKIVKHFIKQTTAAEDIDNIAVELFAAFILKYRFGMFRKKPIHKLLENITNKERTVNLIKMTSSVITRNYDFEVDLAKNISRAY